MLRTFNSPSGHVGSVTKVIKINLGQIYWMNFSAHTNRFVEPDKSYVVSEDVILEKNKLDIIYCKVKSEQNTQVLKLIFASLNGASLKRRIYAHPYAYASNAMYAM